MGVQYELVNIDKKEVISFSGVDTGTKLRELAGTIVASNIITWYLLQNIGDRISFIDDMTESLILFGSLYSRNAFATYQDVTFQTIDQLVEADVLRRVGTKWIDEEEGLSYEVLQNIWDPALPDNK
ncbi:hypothetical protein [Hymenobacter guriensis]|uniref:Uncharacterized protein n=1 Tax=Hymenobacter guriensis TaxID=2793065 RepID=A0ABS0KVN7_9BACT|nr:hypothetical protein [Hymenobacter guriensis]MBG8551932.1 hypothetical protein [Hymenobacter guriensis]